jgi:hypothetical protein
MSLSPEEQMIVRYLKQMRSVGSSLREICRKAGSKDMWKEDERWAVAPLHRLRDAGLVEVNKAGAYVYVEQWG